MVDEFTSLTASRLGKFAVVYQASRSADRTLTSIGSQYQSELNHMNTLQELNWKLHYLFKSSGRNAQVRLLNLDPDLSLRISFNL